MANELNKVISGGIKDGEVKTADIADQAIDLTKLPHGDGSSNGKFLRSNNGADPTWETVSTTPEGTAILSTGETGGTKFLREDGDNSCSWQSVPAGGATLSGSTNNTIVTVTGANAIAGEANLTFDGKDMAIGVTSESGWASDSNSLQIGGLGAIWGKTAQSAGAGIEDKMMVIIIFIQHLQVPQIMR